jgi:ABC-2 type transport system ATP-binding protein
MDEADQYSDEIAIINNGKIVKLGTANELKSSIGGDVMLIKVNGNGVGKKTIDMLKRSRMVKSFDIKNSEMRVVVRDAETILPKVIEILRNNRITINRISITKPSLDDVFLKYAGIKFESGGRTAEIRQTRSRIKRG